MIQDQLKQLYELSQLDAQIDLIRQKIGHVPERREAIEALLQQKTTAVQTKQERLAALEKEKRGIEGELQSSVDRLKEFEQKVNQIKTNKEYQAALKEIAETKQSNKEMEDRILKIMTEIEGLGKDPAGDEAGFQTEKAAAEQELEALAAEEKKIEAEVKDFEIKRHQIQGSLEARLLAQYERIRASRFNPVTLVQNGTCQGCNMKLPPQLFIEIQKFHTIHFCPSCHRILFVAGGSL